MENQVEIWKALPGGPGVEVSTLGNVRILDRLISSETMTRFTKGRILKQHEDSDGYLQVNIPVDGKWATKRVHRLVAQTFIKNTDNLPQVNHKDCNPSNNCVSNLEWCTSEYNIEYREKYGKALSQPVYAVNLRTSKISHFRSRHEASHSLGVYHQNINAVIKGELKQTGGYWFTEDDGNGIEIDKNKLNNILAGTLFRGAVFAVNLKTQEVSQFPSQREASRVLGVNIGTLNGVIKGKYKQSHGYWFTNDDENADDAIKRKLHDIKKIYS